ncbi:DUF4352 domain-containing protein [Streptomyces sp. NBC_00344]|uniref:DUF4352 domain-containing protein n=1 Tax=Streptomyces sp. NBC_00344 TaxID=2975720 RepID=UPI002E223129
MHRLKWVVLPVMLLALTSCQGVHDDQGKARRATSPVVNEKGRPGPGAESAPSGRDMRLGGTADLYGDGSGRRVRVTADAVVDPAITVPAARRPAAGLRRLGIEVKAVNLGGAAYTATAGSVWLIDSTGVRRLPVRSGVLTTGAPFVLRTLAAGDSAEGWLVFELPSSAQPVSLHYSAAANAGGRTAVWQI